MHRPSATVASIAALVLTFAAPARSQTLSVGPVNVQGNFFKENSASFLTPPDSDGAVGLNNYVEFTNGAYTVFNKSDGSKATATISDAQFWLNAGASSALVNEGLSDTRILFDTSSQRWFASELTLGDSNGLNNSILIAVSKDANPLHGFNSTAIVAPASSQFADYDTLSVNHSSVVIGTNNFGTSSFNGSELFNIPTASLLAATPTTAGLFASGNITTAGFTFQGVTDMSGADKPVLALSTDNFFGSNSSVIHLTTVNNPTGGGTSLSTVDVTGIIPYQITQNYAHDPASGPGGTIDNLDARLADSVIDVNGKIYAAWDVNSPNNLSAIQWLVLNDVTHAIISQGVISSPTLDYYAPSIAANAAGDVVIGFTESGPTTFTTTAAVLGTTDGGGAVTFQTPIVMKAGTVAYHGVGDPIAYRWGDYSAIGADPTNPNAFWTTQEYADGRNSWTTQVTELLVTPVPEPSSFALAAVGLSGAGLVAARRRARARKGD